MAFISKAFFRVTIDYNLESRRVGKRLTLYGENQIISKDIVTLAEDIIVHKLPPQLMKSYGLRIRTKVTNVTEGTIILVFSATFGSLMGTYYFISRYKSFKESWRLLKEDLTSLFRQNLARLDPTLEAYVEVLVPRESVIRDEFGRT